MNAKIARSLALSGILATAVSLNSFAGETKKPAKSGTPVVTDWSHSHLIFSQPRTPEQAARVQNDVRYQQQQARHTPHPEATLRTGEEESKTSRLRFWRRHHRRWGGRRMHRDWSFDLGSDATVGAGNFPAKYSFSITTGSCGNVTPPAIPDFVVYGTGPTSGSTTIAALTNLYTPGCSQGGTVPVPASFWAYNTGGQVVTSPVISLDGTQVAFTQTIAGTSSLVLLKWGPFEGLIPTPVALTSVSAAAYAACPTLTVGCMTTLPLGSQDSHSSVYYDYGSDTAWVGDDSGKLHQFTGVFLGTLAEVGSPWPIAVGAALTSPVHDDTSGNTFVADSGGFVYRVDSTGAKTQSARLDFGTGFTEGPMVDSTAGTVYAVSSDDGASSAGVFQLSASFAGGSSGTEATVGAASLIATPTPVYNGAFDHNYVTTPNPPTGNLYVCGNPGSVPTLYQIPITAGVMGMPLVGPVLSTTGSKPCSPVTDVYNAIVTGAGLPQEWVFLSTQGPGFVSACGNVSCIMNFKVTSWQPNFTYNVGQEVLDSNLNIQVAETSLSVSGATPPGWAAGLYQTTSDGAVHWRNQGPLLSTPPNAPWAANTTYGGTAEIIDGNNNIEIATQLMPGTSGATQPTWPTGYGQTIVDGTVTWQNFGANPVAGLSASGGTSGIIMDNTIDNPGGSQVYFTNLQNIGCFTGGVGGCAVQAAQQDLN
jgi:hypothetical protein